MRYGRDWRIRVSADSGEIDPLHEDGLDCEFLLSDEAKEQQPGEPFEAVKRAREFGCKSMPLPKSFIFDTDTYMYPEAAVNKRSVFTFLLYAQTDITFKVEVQILNGIFIADRLMFIDTATIEIVKPARAFVGTTNTHVIVMKKELDVELPYNMPLRTMVKSDLELDAAPTQEMLTQGFLNWLPVKRYGL
jgi:hypothetical protein